MAGSARSMKDKAMASYMKDKGIQRDSGTHCPFGCGRPIALSVQALLSHMTRCKGKPRQDKRNKDNRPS
jgi:hypothetical protein